MKGFFKDRLRTKDGKIKWWDTFVYVCVFVGLILAVNSNFDFVDLRGPKGAEGDQGRTGAVGKTVTQPEPRVRTIRGPKGESGRIVVERRIVLEPRVIDRTRTINRTRTIQGKQGPKGDKGDRGPRGLRGFQGITGPEGPVPPIEPIVDQVVARFCALLPVC